MRSILLATAAIVITATAAQAQAPVQATRTADFLNSIGVNLHLNSEWDTAYSDAANGGTAAGSTATTVNGYTTNVSKIAAALNYAGITRVRVGFGAPYTLSRFQALALASPWLRADVQTDTGATISDQLARAGQVASRIDTFEGMNEATDRTSYYNGVNAAPADCAFQRDLRTAVTAWNATYSQHAPLLAPSVGGDSAGFNQLSACASSSDASNGHSYMDSTPPTAGKAWDLPNERLDAPAGAPNYVTETGPITNNLTSRGMTEDYAAKRTLDLLLAFKKTTVRTYLYELVDENPHTPVLNDQNDPYSLEQEMHFGLFHSDWTAKASAVALHNQAAILLDHGATAGTFTPGSLAYAITGAAPSTYSLLMQKADGTFVLAVWAEPTNWNGATANSAGWASAPASTTVTVSFPAMSAIGASDAFGMAATLPAGSSAKVAITDHPVYLTLTVAPPAPVAPVAPVVPPAPPAPPAPPPVAMSPSGSTITTPGGVLGDAHGDAFTLVATPGLGNQIAMNGKVDGTTSSVVALEWLNGNLFQVNIAGNGWVKVGGAGTWTAVSADVVALCLKH